MTATTYTLSLNIQLPAMTTEFTTSDDCPKRYLRREWKRRYSPHIPQHSSLPVLRLTPNDRPLFLCEKCRSANIYLPLCLWCKWTSSSAVEDFERKTPRPRTLSAPKFSSDLIQRKRPDRKRRAGIIVEAVTSQRDSMDSELSTEPPSTPGSTAALIGLGEEACSYEQIESMLSESLDQTILKSKSDHDDQFVSAPAIEYSDKRPWNYDDCDTQPLTPVEDSPIPMTRPIVHRRDRESTLSEPAHSTCPRDSAARSAANRCMSTPPTYSPFRQARPPRPLYHYIRTNTHALPSNSPFDSGVSHKAPERQVRQLLPDFEASHESPATRDYEFAIPTPHALSYSRKGFSVSGETEQRMDLARRKSDGHDYVFHESKGRKRDRLSDTIRGLTKSLKGVFRVSK